MKCNASVDGQCLFDLPERDRIPRSFIRCDGEKGKEGCPYKDWKKRTKLIVEPISKEALEIASKYVKKK